MLSHGGGTLLRGGGAFDRIVNYVLFILALLALAVTQILAGGRHLALMLPGCALLTLAALLSWWPNRRKAIPRGVVECIGAAAVFFGYVLIRALLSPEEYLARRDLYMALGGTAMYLLVALNFPSSKTRMWFVAGLMVLALANGAVGAVQFFRIPNFSLFHWLPRPDYGSRASGFYGYPNHLSGFLEMAVLMGLSAAFWSRWPSWAKIVTGYSSLVCLGCIVLTGSRGGYISLTVGLLVLTVLSLVVIGKLASNRAIGLMVAGALLIGGTGWAVHRLTAKSFLLQTRADETLTVDLTRLRMWQAAWKQSRLHPIIGTGSGTYLYYGRQFRNPAIQADPVHAHDDYFELLAEYGILGIITMVIFLETHLRHGWNTFLDKATDQENATGLASNTLALTIGSLSAVAACLVHCFLDYNLHMPANLLTAAIIFGLLTDPADEAEEAPSGEEAGPDLPAPFRLALPAFGLWIAFMALPTFPAEYHSERAWEVMEDPSYIISPELTAALEDFAHKGLASDDHNPELHSDLAAAFDARAIQATDAETQTNFRTQALVEATRAMELAPGDVHYVLNVAGELERLHRYAEAGTMFERALGLDPSSGGIELAYANHLQAIGKFREAAEFYKASLDLGTGAAAEDGLQEMVKRLKKLTPAPPTPSPEPDKPAQQ